jgi:hypothetical protein
MTGHINNNDAIPPSRITEIILNKENKQPDELKSVIPALTNHDILIQKSGFIFNSSITDNCLCIGILPYFIDGQRTRHYDIDLPVKGKCLLYGFINSNETLDLLFKPARDTYNGAFLPGIADIFRDNYIRLARFFIENDFAGHFSFDLGTESLFDEIKIFPEAPATMLELARQPAPCDLK